MRNSVSVSEHSVKHVNLASLTFATNWHGKVMLPLDGDVLPILVCATDSLMVFIFNLLSSNTDVLIWTLNSIYIFPPLRRREIYVSKKKKIWRKKRRRPHVGIVQRSGKNAFPPHRILLNPVTWPVVGTYGSWGFFVTTINPPGISWQCPFDDRKLLEANWTKSCVLIMKGVGWSLWTAMSHSITVGNKILKCLPRYESKFVRKTDG